MPRAEPRVKTRLIPRPVCFYPQTLASPCLFSQRPVYLHPAAFMLANSSGSCFSQASRASEAILPTLWAPSPTPSFLLSADEDFEWGRRPSRSLLYSPRGILPSELGRKAANCSWPPQLPQAALCLLLDPQIKELQARSLAKATCYVLLQSQILL